MRSCLQLAESTESDDRPSPDPVAEREADGRFIREYPEVAPDEWHRRQGSVVGRIFGRLFDDRGE